LNVPVITIEWGQSDGLDAIALDGVGKVKKFHSREVEGCLPRLRPRYFAEYCPAACTLP